MFGSLNYMCACSMAQAVRVSEFRCVRTLMSVLCRAALGKARPPNFADDGMIYAANILSAISEV